MSASTPASLTPSPDRGLFSELIGAASAVVALLEANGAEIWSERENELKCFSDLKKKCRAELPPRWEERLSSPLFMLLPPVREFRVIVGVGATSTGGVTIQVVLSSPDAIIANRWECPEDSSTGPSKHGFFHVQPIQKVRVGKTTADVIPLEVEGRLACPCADLPTIPVAATDVVTLVDAMFVSIYGVGYLDEWARMLSDSELLKKVYKRCEGLGWHDCRKEHLARPKGK